MNIQGAFAVVSAAMQRAAQAKSGALASATAEKCGLVKQGDNTPRQLTVWEHSEGKTLLRFSWHWRDSSQSFSVRPEKNTLSLELYDNGIITQRAEATFEG